MDGWAGVPDVLLLHIYSYLSSNDKLAASSTCKHWRQLLFHPVNWSHINFYYNNNTTTAAKEEDLNHPRNRENFLKCRTGHFISSCSVLLPTEPQLLTDNLHNAVPQPCYSSSKQHYLDADVCSLFQYLSINKKLTALSIIQCSPYPSQASVTNSNYRENQHKFYHRTETQCTSSRTALKATATAFSTTTSIINSNNNNGAKTTATGSSRQKDLDGNSNGVLTRSKSQKMRERCLKAYQFHPCNEYFGTQTTYSSTNSSDHSAFSRPVSNLCCPVHSSTNFSTFSESSFGSNLQLVDYLKRIIATSNSLKHLSLGYLPSVTFHNNEIVKYLVQYQSGHLRSLHLSRCQELSEFVYEPVNAQDLLMLRWLQHLSIDTADLSDQLLVSLSESGRVKLESLCLAMFSHKEGVRPVHDRTWDLLHQSCPDLILTLNIIRCPEAIRDMMTVINASMPLTHLKILFCDEFYVSGFHHVARHQASTLRSLHIVESMREGPMYYDISVDEQDPFVMMAWRCKHLSSFCVLGIALREHDVLAVARLRGMQLHKFEVLEECITSFNHGESEFEEDFSMSFETFCEEISTSIGQNWLPLTEEDVDDSLTFVESPESSAFLPLLMKDQQRVFSPSF